MGEEGGILFFKGRGAAFNVQSNSWVSLKSKWVSIQIIPEIGPCLFTHRSSDGVHITQFVLKPRIKAKKTGSSDTVAWIFKAGRLHNKQMVKPQICAVRFASTKSAMKFKEAYVTAFEEWNNTDWDCPLCTVRNNSNVFICEMCNTARPATRKKEDINNINLAEEASGDEVSDYERKSFSKNMKSLHIHSPRSISDDEKWSCKWCSFSNSSQTHVCQMCSKSKQTGWRCNLCTYENPMTNNKCVVCGNDFDGTEEAAENIIELQRKASDKDKESFLSESEVELQQAADYILSRHPDGLVCFKTLRTICEKLYHRVEKYRVLWVDSPTFQKKLLSFDGAMEFLKLLGFNLDNGQEKFVCKISDPKESILDEAMEILKNVISGLERRKPPKDDIKSPLLKSRLPSDLLQRVPGTSLNLGIRNRGSGVEIGLPIPGRESDARDSITSDDGFKSTQSFQKKPTLGHTPGASLTLKALKDLDDGRVDDINDWFEEEEIKEEVISLHNLVYWLTKEKDDVGMGVLLLVHRTFSSSENLLEVLINRFREASELSDSDKIKRNVMQFFVFWVFRYFEDFESQPCVGDDFMKFLEQSIEAEQCSKMAKIARDRFIENQKKKEKMPSVGMLPIPERMSKKILDMTGAFKTEQTVTGFTVKEVAELMTLLDYEKFKRINHRELLNQAWKKKDRELMCSNVLNMIAQYNRVCKWTQIAILNARGLEMRQKTLKWFIKLATHLITIQNYNSSWAVNGALNSTPIYNLKHTWTGINRKLKEAFDQQTQLFRAAGNYRLLRQKMESLQPPAIPQIGILLKDLVFIDDGFLLMGTETGYQINFRKCIKLAERITEGFGKFQSQPFKFQRNDMVLAWLQDNQDKVSEVKESFLLELSDQVRVVDAREKSKRFWS